MLPVHSVFILFGRTLSPLCSIIKETPTYQKSKFGGMYHLTRSRFTALSFIKHPLSSGSIDLINRKYLK